MPEPTTNQSTNLYYREGSSDKVYQAAIEPSGPGYIVTFAFGRRGTTLQTGTKTASPVGLEEAKKIYDKLVKEKTAKGYTPGEDGARYQQTDKADRATGLVPQLLNPIQESETQKYIADAEFWAQEKFDGRRAMIRKTAGSIVGINRLGLTIALPEELVAHARTLGSEQWLIDGEAVGEMFYAFDLLELGNTDLRQHAYAKRLRSLGKLVALDAAPIRAVETATTSTGKMAMLGRLKGSNAEGIVFKRHTAFHAPGRPASGGSWLKVKFTATASCIVAGINGSKRSVKLELLQAPGNRVSVGNVTIPATQEIPAKGQIVEVRYLYAYPGGSLFQPVYLSRRDDVLLDVCTVSQLKFKAGTEEEDDK